MHDLSSNDRYSACARVPLLRPILEEADRIELEYYAVWFEAGPSAVSASRGSGASVNFGSDAP